MGVKKHLFHKWSNVLAHLNIVTKEILVFVENNEIQEIMSVYNRFRHHGVDFGKLVWFKDVTGGNV